jgi:hypothetical protein
MLLMRRPIIAFRANCVPLGILVGLLVHVILDAGIVPAALIGLGVTLLVGSLRVRAGAYPDLPNSVDAYTVDEEPFTPGCAMGLGCLSCMEMTAEVISIPLGIIFGILSVMGGAATPEADASTMPLPRTALVAGLVILTASVAFAMLKPVIFGKKDRKSLPVARHREGPASVGADSVAEYAEPDCPTLEGEDDACNR